MTKHFGIRAMPVREHPARQQGPKNYEVLLPLPCDCCGHPLLQTVSEKLTKAYERCTQIGCAQFGVAQ